MVHFERRTMNLVVIFIIFVDFSWAFYISLNCMHWLPQTKFWFSQSRPRIDWIVASHTHYRKRYQISHRKHSPIVVDSAAAACWQIRFRRGKRVSQSKWTVEVAHCEIDSTKQTFHGKITINFSEYRIHLAILENVHRKNLHFSCTGLEPGLLHRSWTGAYTSADCSCPCGFPFCPQI